jgi:hypothetical protein
MLIGTVHDVPDWVTGLVGAVFIAVAFWSSVRWNRRAAARAAPGIAGPRAAR